MQLIQNAPSVIYGNVNNRSFNGKLFIANPALFENGLASLRPLVSKNRVLLPDAGTLITPQDVLSFAALEARGDRVIDARLVH